MLDTLLIMLDVIIVLPSFVLAHLGVLHVSPMYSLCTYFVCEWSRQLQWEQEIQPGLIRTGSADSGVDTPNAPANLYTGYFSEQSTGMSLPASSSSLCVSTSHI